MRIFCACLKTPHALFPKRPNVASGGAPLSFQDPTPHHRGFDLEQQKDRPQAASRCSDASSYSNCHFTTSSPLLRRWLPLLPVLALVRVFLIGLRSLEVLCNELAVGLRGLAEFQAGFLPLLAVLL